MKKSSHLTLSFYLCLGTLHELAHVIAVVFLCVVDKQPFPFNVSDFSFWIDLLLFRETSLKHSNLTDEQLSVIRHFGWIFSIVLAASMSRRRLQQVLRRQQRSDWSAGEVAAWITALEAISTDLLGLSRFTKMNSFPRTNMGSQVFHCGNFGILLLHHLWFENAKGRAAALDCLQQMVQITMMRGAQSGGVVTYLPSKEGLRGKRCRVVNKKRTDLSKELLKRVSLSSNLPRDCVPFLQGHTRFATSSISTLDGTHPHQWTVPMKLRIYDFDKDVFQDRNVENFITHNGDLEFFMLNGKTYDIESVFAWLETVLDCPAPASVDSMGVAGLIDLLRCQGSFTLAARYALCMGMKSCTMKNPKTFPSRAEFNKVADIFEKCWHEIVEESLKSEDYDLSRVSSQMTDSVAFRTKLALAVSKSLSKEMHIIQPLKDYAGFSEDEEDSTSLFVYCIATVQAFLDNDTFFSVQRFLDQAKGSFGLVVSSSLDADRRLIIAARGQTMSIAFYPKTGLICFGSEQSATKAGLHAAPQDSVLTGLDLSVRETDADKDATRLDLDDLGGEIVLLDFTKGKQRLNPSVSKPSRHLPVHEMMHNTVRMVIYQESRASTLDTQIYHRLTRLSRNGLMTPLQPPSEDPVLQDISDIPKTCRDIQDEFHSSKAGISMNRLAAFHLASVLKARLNKKVAGRLSTNSVDILLTGCEVSLWTAEQFAADFKKSFPRLNIQALSSNKILGMFGQEIPIPSLGFPFSSKTADYDDTIVIIVSHSGGTFAPLACSNLLQSTTKNIFLVTGQWDTQIGKNLRSMDDQEVDVESLLKYRIFTTGIGVRTAEPCSLSVVATHQLLTSLFTYLCVVILSDGRFCRETGATISAVDVEILERCSQMGIGALTEIVGVNSLGYKIDRESATLKSLRSAGDLWAEHILENARAYLMCFVYIFGTVISGFPLAYGIAAASGLDSDSPWVYPIKIIDAAIYFWLPQMSIILLRLWQGRNLLHRMTGRTVVIGDIPWVSQSAEAFLSKIFAVSYSIAGLNVLSGNPSDHLVHRHTHRVVRGTLAIFGRPDGRLSALSTTEASVCLSVNQASSIQSWGGTCESITLGHNPFKLDLSLNGIFLKRHRPLFLCERLLAEDDAKQETMDSLGLKRDSNKDWRFGTFKRLSVFLRKQPDYLSQSMSMHRVADCSISLKANKDRSAPALLGAYLDIADTSKVKQNDTSMTNTHNAESPTTSVESSIVELIQNRKQDNRLQKLFSQIDMDQDGLLNEREFISGLKMFMRNMSDAEGAVIFRQTDIEGSGFISFKEFEHFVQSNGLGMSMLKLPPSHRDERGIIQIETNKETYFGATVRKLNSGKSTNQEVDFELLRKQHIVQELYETRIASMQRFVSLCVMFHHMGKRVENFFDTISFGYWSYRMDRTHSIMRIATTASPISGATVRQRMEHIRLLKKVQHSVDVISNAYHLHRQKKENYKKE